MTTTANELLQPGSRTASLSVPQYSAISEHSSVKGTPTHIRDWLTSLLPASHVNRSVSPASEKALTTTETSGLKPSMSFAEYDHDSRTWRTYQVSLLTLMQDEFTETWPKAGMTVSGVGYPLPKQELRIAAIDGGAWPTPAASDTKGSVIGETLEDRLQMTRGVRLPEEVMRRMLPTPTTPRPHDSENTAGKYMASQKQHDLTAEVAMDGGQLNPMWVEWLMGWPLGWTALKPLEMDKYRQWLEQHGICSASDQTRIES